MPFLSKEELKTVIRLEKVVRIATSDDETISKAINTAITEVGSRLTPNKKKAWLDGRIVYDIPAIFAQQGEDRNPLILDITKIVAVWWLIVQCNAGVEYETIRDRYGVAVEYLKDLAGGEATDLTLPIKQEPVDDQGNPIGTEKPFSAGSNKKFNHYF